MGESVRDAAEKRGCPRGELPVVVGFGISQRSHVNEFGAFADGCVVGSRIVQALGSEGPIGAGKIVRDLSGGPLLPSAATAQPTSFTMTGANGNGNDDKKKHADKWNFGGSVFGGRFIPETLMVAHAELEAAWNKYK